MSGGNIKVVVRVRPLNSREIQRNAKCVVQMKDKQTILQPPPDAEERLRKSSGKGGDGQKVFAYDHSYWSFDRNDSHYAGQDSVFNDLGKPLLDNAFQGYNNCIFAYGQTGSGKSYSMMGYGEESGVIPRICQSMFERIEQQQKNDSNLSYTVEVSYLEIYNERVRDLLNPANKGNLRVREHPSTGPYVEDLAKLAVRSFKDIDHLMDEGNKARTVAATNMNETSSRSHAVFTLTVTQKRHDVETKMAGEKVSKISLVDLAGSERQTSTGATGSRLKEGAEINRSLSTLGRVIAALADLSTGKKKNMTVPYRDSVLTWLLKDSLGGNSMTAMIAAISPADINFEETLSTLRYADSAKRIKNHAVVNEDPNARMIRELKEELAQLRSKLSGGGASGVIAEEQYAPDTPLEKQMVSITQSDGSVKRVSKAEIAEQLNQSEKLYEDLNQTWEEKLEKTEKIHKEREAALEELGISIEKGFVGVSTPKRMPHLVNLSDDPLLTECLVYNIKPGTTMVGNVENASEGTEIRLNGSKILREHCSFENVDGQVTLVPRDNASIMINGRQVDSPTRLRSGNRMIIGDFHIFRFNHPQEAREERKEQSLLRHSVTSSQLGSPAQRPMHSRVHSKYDSEADNDVSRPDSPMPPRSNRESDWAFARREAAGVLLGPDQKIHDLNDDELDALFENVQRARAVRKGRSESRVLNGEDEDSETASSFAFREKYMSNGTLDDFSLDTALTIPSTPPHHDEFLGSDDGQLETVREAMQGELAKQKQEYEGKLRDAQQSSGTSVEDLKAEKLRMEKALAAAKEDYERQLEQQKQAFAKKVREASLSPTPKKPRVTLDGMADLPEEEKAIIREYARKWRNIGYIRLSEALLKYAATLKEAQVLSQVMDKRVHFQFCIIGKAQDLCSSYDLVLSGISGDEDPALETTTKPCVAIRVMDYQSNVIHLWSLEKLDQRVKVMRQLHQYLDRPDYLQHFKLDNPFVEAALPQFSLIGEANIPMTAVFEARVQDYAVEVFSTFTLQPVGTIKLSLEPSSAQAPMSMLKFNVVMHEMSGFAEREGTDIHCQMLIPGVSDEGGATTTQIIRDFDEGPIRFESVHSMGVPRDAPRDATLRVALHGKVTSMHLDKLLSWDEIREYEQVVGQSSAPNAPRLPEKEYWAPEEHDVYMKVKVLEMSETGEYVPVEIEQTTNLDPGTYQLHQGLQRRIIMSLNCSSSEALQWKAVKALRVGDIKLVQPGGTIPDQPEADNQISLRLISEPKYIEDSAGVKEINIIGQWDSSLHGSLLLDRTTPELHSVQASFSVEVSSDRVAAPMFFNIQQNFQVHSRAWLRPQSMFKQFWKTTRIIHYTSAMFSISLNPASAKRAADIWRLNSQQTYVKGEEELEHWQPRGVSLIRDYARFQRSRQRVTDVETTKVFLRRHRLAMKHQMQEPKDSQLSPHDERLLQKSLTLWTTASALPNTDLTLSTSTLHPAEPPIPTTPNANINTNGTSTPSPPTPSKPPALKATISLQHKNPICLKSSFLLTPTTTPTPATIRTSNPSTKTTILWLRHFAELRSPYLHLYSVPSGEEAATINLRNARIDLEPPIQRLLCPVQTAGGDVVNRSPSSGRKSSGSGAGAGGGKNIFAVYARGSSWVFAAKNEEEKGRWVLAMDEAFLGTAGGGSSPLG